MATITIGAATFDAYVTLAEAESYLAGSMTATVWRASTSDDDKGRAIVSASRLLDRQRWKGEQIDEYIPHAFPRTGLVYDDGSAVPDTAVPQEVLDAVCELAAELLAGNEAATKQEPGLSNVQSLAAGSVNISFFRTEEGVGKRFPLSVMELIGRWLAGVGYTGARSHGTCKDSDFDDCDYLGFNSGV